jgi:hypothetical protein
VDNYLFDLWITLFFGVSNQHQTSSLAYLWHIGLSGISVYLGCITTRGNGALLYFPRKIWYDGYMTNEEIASLLDKESYRIWDTTKVIKNQDYHDGLVKGLKMAAKFVRNQG